MLTLLAFDAFAQRQVSGVIAGISSGEGQRLQGVCIWEGETDNETHTVKITQDTVILHVVLEPDTLSIEELVVMGHTHWEYKGMYKTVIPGVTYNATNAMFGLTVSNGHDNLQLMPSGLPIDRYVYQMNVQTDFHRDYMFDASIGWLMYPYNMQYFSNRYFSNRKYIRYPVLLSAGYRQYYYPSQNFIHRDIYLFATTVLKNYIELTVKTGYQTLNDCRNWGATAGFQKAFTTGNWHPNGLSIGVSSGYYFDYYTFSLSMQILYLTKCTSLKLSFDRIDTYSFFNIGLNYLFPI
jgi:hypothetical protein